MLSARGLRVRCKVLAYAWVYVYEQRAAAHRPDARFVKVWLPSPHYARVYCSGVSPVLLTL